MESLIAKPEPISADQLPAGEMGHSLLALIQTHQEPETDERPNLVENLARGLEQTARQREESASAARLHSLQMAEMYNAISELLDLLRLRIEQESSPKVDLEPLAVSMTHAFAEMNARLEANEERQQLTIENTLKQWETERQSTEADRLLQIESLQVQAQMEFNRLLRVMWLGTGLAAIGAGTALFLTNN